MVDASKSHTKAQQKANTETESSAPFETFKKFTDKMSKAEIPKMGREEILHHHRKNMEVLSEAQKMAIDVIKNISQLQAQFMRQTLEEMSSSMKEVMRHPTSQEKMNAHVEKVKQTMTNTVDHTSHIADIIMKSNTGVYELMQDRFKEGIHSVSKPSSRTH